jgi:hypothetical protein
MAQSYTPGLKVLTNTPSEKARQLPLKGEVLVEVGDSVDSHTVVASTYIPGNVQMLNVARQLNVEADNVPDCMLVGIDEDIKKGQVIAESKGLFGFFKSQLKSPIDGTLANVSNITGQALLSEPPIAIEVDAFSAGTIKQIIPEEGVIISSDGALVQGILGVGGESQGEIILVVNSRQDIITKEMLNESHAGKIVIAGSYLPLDVFTYAQSLGINGIVVGGFDYDSLSSILGYNLGVAVTGSEELGISLMLTEGFGEIAMAEGTFNLFRQFEGKFASINGSTQIRAGVIRPEVMIPHTEDIKSIELKESDMIISEHSPVRVIRSPYFGKVGTVLSLPTPLVQMESETMVRVAEVKFEDGDVFTIPRANLEMILH